MTRQSAKPPATARHPGELLRWYGEMGVDEAVSDVPRDRLARSVPAEERAAPAVPQKHPAGAPRPATTAVLTPEQAAAVARQMAGACKTLDELRARLETLECPLRNTATNLVFEDGSRQARVMFIGEAPGRDEDIEGKPFVGRSGRLLDRMLKAIGLDRDQAYITNVIYWRPPGNRTPTPAETALCRPFAARQIELIDPALVVFLGGVAAKEMLDTTTGILRLRGKWRQYPAPDGPYRAIATLHPAYLLRQPGQKKLAWRDFLSIRRALDEIAG